MDAPPVQYTTTRDGKKIAYTVCGEGTPLVFLPLLSNHARYSWHFFRAWYEALAANFRFVAYDARGEGLSTRGFDPDFEMSDWQLDLEAVIDASGVERPVLMAGCHSGHVAVRFAVEHPEQVSALVLNTVSVDMASWGAFFWQQVPAENWSFFLDTLLPRGVSKDEAAVLKQELRQMFTAEEMNAAGPVIMQSTIEEDLRSLRTPTLVLHPRHMNLLDSRFGAALAAAIPGSRFALTDGEYVFGDAEAGLAAISGFLAEAASSAPLPDHHYADLSVREVEVLRLLAGGRSNAQIADALVISPSTVAKHVTSILAKTESANRTEAGAYAHRHGLV
jgi:pimeloyl-ACP methyl ester carboxylesterase/DNA-binding CsgD family transcriptional regulator